MALAKSSVQSMMGFTAKSSHPVVLVGSYDNNVHAYSVEYGRVLGTMAAHNDAVSSVLLPDVGRAGCLRCSARGWAGASTGSLATSSWDGTIRLWDVEEGRGTWGAAPDARYVIHEMEYDCALLCLDTAAHGAIVAGAEDGCAVAWDPRASSQSVMWSSSLNRGAVNAVMSLSNGSYYVVAGSQEGEAHVIDIRKSGAELLSVRCGGGVRCTDTDGLGHVVVGTDGGAVLLWDLREEGGDDAAAAAAAGKGGGGEHFNLRNSQSIASTMTLGDAVGGVASLCLVDDEVGPVGGWAPKLVVGCGNGSICLFRDGADGAAPG